MPITGPETWSAARCAAPRSRQGDPIQTDLFGDGKALDHAGAAQQLQIVEALVARDVAGVGHTDGAREQ
jgi:hypothetical protein